MPIQIRPATVADVENIVAFNAALAWESEGKRLDETVLRPGVQAVLDDAAKGFYVIAEREGEVVGQSSITFEWSDWRNGWYWWIQSVYVVEQARRQGVFSAIYSHLEERARADAHVIGIRLYVEKENHRAQQTYAALGLEDEGYLLMGRYPLPGRETRVSQQ